MLIYQEMRLVFILILRIVKELILLAPKYDNLWLPQLWKKDYKRLLLIINRVKDKIQINFWNSVNHQAF